MAHLNQKSDDDLRFDFQNSTSGSEEDVPPASTIYDPSVLALSPELREKVAAREARNQNADDQRPKRDDPGNGNSHIHVFSPGARTAKKPFEMGVDGKTIRASGGDLEDARDNEIELCCFGYIPFYPSLTFVNMINFMTGLIALSIGSHQAQFGSRTIVGFGSSESLVISGAHIIGIASVCVGLLLCLSAGFGIFISISVWKAPRLRRKWLELVNQCLVILLALLCFVLFVANAVALSTAGRDAGVYDDMLWGETVQTAPVYSCRTEIRLGCAGFERQQCQFDANETSNSFCPGHFCIDFCKVATDDVNQQEICDPCGDSEKSSVFELLACKDFEKNMTGGQGCKVPINDDLRARYTRLLVAALLSFASVVVTITVSFYQLCCA